LRLVDEAVGGLYIGDLKQWVEIEWFGACLGLTVIALRYIDIHVFKLIC